MCDVCVWSGVGLGGWVVFEDSMERLKTFGIRVQRDGTIQVLEDPMEQLKHEELECRGMVLYSFVGDVSYPFVWCNQLRHLNRVALLNSGESNLCGLWCLFNIYSLSFITQGTHASGSQTL